MGKIGFPMNSYIHPDLLVVFFRKFRQDVPLPLSLNMQNHFLKKNCCELLKITRGCTRCATALLIGSIEQGTQEKKGQRDQDMHFTSCSSTLSSNKVVDYSSTYYSSFPAYGCGPRNQSQMSIRSNPSSTAKLIGIISFI